MHARLYLMQRSVSLKDLDLNLISAAADTWWSGYSRYRPGSKVYYSATGEPGVKGTVAKVVSEGDCNALCRATAWLVLYMHQDVAWRMNGAYKLLSKGK